MSRPKATNGDTLTDEGWNISDAEAFHINDAEKWHLLASFPTGVSVRGKCGVMASTLPYDHLPRRATWAGGYSGTLCPTCASYLHPQERKRLEKLSNQGKD